MKTTELRIGNLVLINGEAKPIDVLEVDNFGFIDPIDPKPVEIDDFCFNIFRFTKVPMGWIRAIDETLYLEVLETKGGFYPTLCQFSEFSHQDDAQITLRKIEYVHELQNLWHVLTKEEL